MSKTRKKDVNLELDHETKGWTIQLVTSERQTNKLCPKGTWTYDFLCTIKIFGHLVLVTENSWWVWSFVQVSHRCVLYTVMITGGSDGVVEWHVCVDTLKLMQLPTRTYHSSSCKALSSWWQLIASSVTKGWCTLSCISGSHKNCSLWNWVHLRTENWLPWYQHKHNQTIQSVPTVLL